MEFCLLGPLEVRVDGRPVPLGGPKPRAVLSVLLLDAGRVVPVDRVLHQVWGPSAPAGAQASLQVYVSGLRKLLEPVPGEHRVLLSRAPGYLLDVRGHHVDVVEFRRLVAQGRDDLSAGRHDGAAARLGEALALWRGEPLADVPLDDVGIELDRLRAERLAALDDRVAADLACGRHAALVPELEAAVAEHPLREATWAHLMLAQYRSGMQTEALETYARARRLLVEDYGIDPGPGLRELEGRVLAQHPALAPPPGARRLTVKLPARPDALVGREAEVAEVCALLRRPDVTAVTLTGPGGTGKTSLAVEVAGALVDDHPGGVWFVPLADVVRGDQVAPAVAAVLEVGDGAGEPLLDALAVSLRGGAALLVLDNLEQVEGAGAAVAALLRHVPRLHVLATSRSALHLRGEHEHPVPGLALPSPAARGDDVRSAAVQVFLTRYAAVRPDFDPGPEDLRAVADVCVRLDGLPLAIELAAARGRLLDPVDMVGRLEDQLRFLSGGPADLPDRQRTMRGVVDWSYRLLRPDHRLLLARLGAVVGELSMAGAAAAAGTVPDDPDLADGLEALVDSSLVRARRAGQVRFRLLEPVREYASELLAASGEQDRVRRDLLAHAVQETEAAAPLLDGPGAAAVADRLELDYPTTRGLLDWAVEQGLAVEAGRLAVALGTFWYAAGRLQEGRELLGRVVALGPAAPAVHLGAGSFAYLLDDSAAALDHLRDAVRLARADGDDETTASALAYLGAVRLGRGEDRSAEAAASEALALARTCGSYPAQALALSLLAVLAATQGDLDRERRHSLDRLELARGRGDRRRAAETLNNLAELELSEGAVTTARVYAEEALQLARGSGRTGTRDVLLSLARLALLDRDADRAQEHVGEALTLSAELGQQFEVSQCLLVRAGVALLRDDPQLAARLYGCASRLRGEGSPLEVELESDLAAQRRRVRDLLGDDRFLAAHVSGAVMPLHEAVVLAADA